MVQYIAQKYVNAFSLILRRRDQTKQSLNLFHIALRKFEID